MEGDPLLQLTLDLEAFGSLFDLVCSNVFWNLELVSSKSADTSSFQSTVVALGTRAYLERIEVLLHGILVDTQTTAAVVSVKTEICR